MECPNCGAGNPEGKKFCGDCGVRLPEQTSPDFQPMQFSGVGMRDSSERTNLRHLGRAALIIGFAVLVVSVILFVLSNALVHQEQRLFGEGGYARAIDVANMVDIVSNGAWITLGVAIVCTVGGAVAYMSGDAAGSRPIEPAESLGSSPPKEGPAQHELPVEEKFCRHCGKRIVSDSTFCEHCGKKL